MTKPHFTLKDNKYKPQVRVGFFATAISFLVEQLAYKIALTPNIPSVYLIYFYRTLRTTY